VGRKRTKVISAHLRGRARFGVRRAFRVPMSPAQDVALWFAESPLDHLELLVLLASCYPKLSFRDFFAGYLLHLHAEARRAGDVELLNRLHRIAV
jgi:hypothetical protein